MTKHRDVNKCRRPEKYKMAALIRQANKRVRNGQKTKDKKKKRTHGEKEGEKREKTTLSEKKEEASDISKQRDTGWIHVIRVSTRHNPLSSDNNTAGQQTHELPHTKKE